MPFVSPHDRKTTQFHAVIKRQVIVDFAGEDPVIIEESPEFRLATKEHGLIPVGAPEGTIIASARELLEAAPCSETGVLYAVEDLDEEGRGPEAAAELNREDLVGKSQAELIRYILKLEKQAAGTAPAPVEAATETAPATEKPKRNRSAAKPVEEAPADEATEGSTKSVKKRKQQTLDVEGGEAGDAAEPVQEEPEVIKAAQPKNEEEVEVAF